jgi:hypothetical protein
MAGTRITQLWPYGGPGERYGAFAGKVTPTTVRVMLITEPRIVQATIEEPRIMTGG